MRLCAYWDCMEEVEEGISFCREHARKLNLQLIDKCPKCGRYKDVRQNLCPDCNYGRPVAGWKISSRNLEEVDESQEQPVTLEEETPQYELPTYEDEISINSNAVSRGEATCPSCGSPNLTYKKVFDYFKCNDCETTFITPVYSYGEVFKKERADTPPTPPTPPPVEEEPRMMAPPPVRQEPPQPRYIPPQPPVQYNPPPPVRNEPQSFPPRYEPAPPPMNQPPVYRDNPPAQREQYWPPQETVPWSEPVPPYQPPREKPKKTSVFSLFSRPSFDDNALQDRAIKMAGGQASKMGWLYLGVVLSIIVLIAVALWFVFHDQIADILGDLF